MAVFVLKPWLVRYALARPSARGLHTTPTPQGGGIAVLCGCVAGVALGSALLPMSFGDERRLSVVLAAAAGLGLLGLVDDIRPLPALPRLAAQLAFMAVGVAVLPAASRPLPFLPFWIERGLLVVGGAWFINLTNFMDGMDGITVAEVVPISVALVALWALGVIPGTAGLLALALLGAMLGFAPFNKPIARLFLGDVGSLPIGFLVAYCLIGLAGETRPSLATLAAAAILPLYYIADSGLTLIHRLVRRERIWEPHRSHAYQIAATRERSPWLVLARIAGANAALLTLALMAVEWDSGLVSLLAMIVAIMVVAGLIRVLISPDQAARR